SSFDKSKRTTPTPTLIPYTTLFRSVKTQSELPRRMKIASLTKAYKLIPTRLVLSVEDLTKFSIGPKTKKRLSLYQEYLHVRDKQDRKSTRLNSSHVKISYAVFCLKK